MPPTSAACTHNLGFLQAKHLFKAVLAKLTFALFIFFLAIQPTQAQRAEVELQSAPPSDKIKNADPAPVASTKSAPKPQKTFISQAAIQLYTALLKDTDQDTIALALQEMVLRLGRPCKAVHAYQIAAFQTGSRSIRIKCSLRPVYQIRISAQGLALLEASDGQVKALEAYPEPIVEVSGVSAERFLRQEALMPKPAIIRPLPLPKPNNAPSLLEGMFIGLSASFWMACAGIFVLFTLLGYTFLSYRRYKHSKRWATALGTHASPVRDKDMLLEESWEIYPRIFKHPQGFFLARGRTGKRRLFRSSMGALLYRDFGVRIGEIKP
jgi:hypothetical protein